MDALADLANLLKDPQNSLSVGIVKELDLAKDRSVLRALVSTWPDGQEIVCRVTWDSIGPGAGIIQFPQPNDLVLICFPEKDTDSALLIRRLSSREDFIPESAEDGSLVLKSLSGKKAWLTSDTKINLSKGDTDPTENLVLGQVFKQFAIDLLTKISSHLEKNATEMHIGNLGFNTGVPTNAAEYTTIKTAIEALKSSPVEDLSILSDLVFTEK